MKIEFYVPDKYGDVMQDSLQNIIDQVLEALQESEWPQTGDNYYYIAGNGEVVKSQFNSEFDYDCDSLEFGNCFKTKEEAEFKREQLKVLHELEELADDDQKWDGKNGHYIIVYDHENNEIALWDYQIFHPHSLCFKSKESAQAAIDKIGEDRLKKYYFCVGEIKNEH